MPAEYRVDVVQHAHHVYQSSDCYDWNPDNIGFEALVTIDVTIPDAWLNMEGICWYQSVIVLTDRWDNSGPCAQRLFRVFEHWPLDPAKKQQSIRDVHKVLDLHSYECSDGPPGLELVRMRHCAASHLVSMFGGLAQVKHADGRFASEEDFAPLAKAMEEAGQGAAVHAMDGKPATVHAHFVELSDGTRVPTDTEVVRDLSRFERRFLEKRAAKLVYSAEELHCGDAAWRIPAPTAYYSVGGGSAVAAGDPGQTSTAHRRPRVDSEPVVRDADGRSGQADWIRRS